MKALSVLKLSTLEGESPSFHKEESKMTSIMQMRRGDTKHSGMTRICIHCSPFIKLWSGSLEARREQKIFWSSGRGRADHSSSRFFDWKRIVCRDLQSDNYPLLDICKILYYGASIVASYIKYQILQCCLLLSMMFTQEIPVLFK